ncbi:MAG: cupin domain-containing protein, partial [Thermodesulfobacteriota bacterium]
MVDGGDSIRPMGWNDVGSWEALRDILKQDDQGNILQGDVFAMDTTNTFVRSEDRLVATLGVGELVVVDTPDALLVCRGSRSQEVKKVAEKLREDQRDEVLLHRRVEKPWGAYRVVDRSAQYQVKWLDVEPGQRLSLQSHEHRSEHWTVVRGTATVTLDDRILEVPQGGHVHIPVRTRHRLENRSEEGTLRIIEVQTGKYLGEDDIVRYDDDYGRTR